MKRLLSVVLVMLLLTACAASETPTVSTEVNDLSAEQLRQNLPKASALIAEHPAVDSNSGAVTVYDLSCWGVGSFSAVYPCEAGVAALESSGVLWIFDPRTGLVTDAFADVFDLVGMDSVGFATAQSDTAVATFLFSDPTAASWTLPDDIQGRPVADPAGRQIYYCTPGKVFALDMSTGLTRLVREHSYAELMPKKISGQVLELVSGEKAVLISAEDGRMIQEVEASSLLHFFGTKYLVSSVENSIAQTLLMEHDEVVVCLDASAANVIPMPQLDGILVRSVDGLLHYSLPEGKLTSQISVPASASWIRAGQDCVWILDENILYRWDLSVQTQLYAAEDITKEYHGTPTLDLEGIEQCKIRAAGMTEVYGLKINIWDDVKAEVSLDLEPENRVDVINAQLDSLERVLRIIPEGFLEQTVQDDWLYVDLVKNIEGDHDFAQYWHNGGCHVAITGEANMEEAFYTGLGWAVDTHILGNSRDLEYWEELNPKEFAYDLDYAKAQARDDAQCFADGVRYFADARSMAFPSEDRARIFYYAITEGNEALFENIILQKKLRLVCDGIRESYALEDYEEALPWEQYLD